MSAESSTIIDGTMGVSGRDRRIWACWLFCLLGTHCGSSSPPVANIEGAGDECLVRVISGLLDIVPLKGRQHTQQIPTPDPIGLSWGRVSPSGTFIVGTDGTRLNGVAFDGRELWRIQTIVSGFPSIKADEARIAFASDGRIDIYDVKTGERETIVKGGLNPAWAPDSDRIAYDDGANVRVYDLISATSYEVGKGTHPSWSSDGGNVAVRVGTDEVDVINVQNLARRTFAAASYVSPPRWSPNGRWLFYTHAGGGSWWSLDGWLSDPYQVILRDARTGAESSIGMFYKGQADYTWVTNRTLCRDDSANQ
jgi:Tol biopolymer transport system component